MAKKSAIEIVSGILLAFMEERTWTQAGLARHLGLDSQTVRKHLERMPAEGIPLEQEYDHPHVYWSVPSGWVPGGVVLAQGEAQDLLRLLVRQPRTRSRDAFLRRLVAAAPTAGALAGLESTVVSGPADPDVERLQAVVEDAMARKVAVRLRYCSTRAGVLESRHVSLVREVVRERPSFIARCHRDDLLKWWRFDRAADAILDPDEPFRPTPDAEVEAFLAGSIGGFHSGAAPIRCALRIRSPESRWVQNNLPCPMRLTREPDGIRLELETSGLQTLARWVVGLGAAATAETAELQDAVRALAEGALAATGQRDPEGNRNV